MDKKSTKDLMQMLGLNETVDQLARADCVCWYGHVFRKDKSIFMSKALDSKVKGTRKTWLKAVVEQSSKKFKLNESDVNNRSRWRLRVNTISSKMR